MVLPKLPYNFHDAGVASITIGPRREVTLVVALDDPTHPPHHRVYIRFGGITNFSEVATFLEQVPSPREQDAYRARIDRLDYDPHEQSGQHNLVFQLSLDMVGEVRIRCRNVSAGPDSSLDNETSALS
jgi:hypothetical protein